LRAWRRRYQRAGRHRYNCDTQPLLWPIIDPRFTFVFTPIPLTAVRTVTIPYLAPALVGAFVVAFLMSFENFNTTLMLVGSDAPLTISMFDRLQEGSTPLLNAVSLMLMVGSSLLALVMIVFQKR
jgi:ABC-type molybdate transport system permease subunit